MTAPSLTSDSTLGGKDFTYSSDLPRCNLTIATSYDTYPSYWTCDRGGTSDEQFCYIASNTADDKGDAKALETAHREGLFKAITECCDGGGPGALEPCIQWCPYPKDLESWNECLTNKGYGPSYNDTGLVRDTYCVPSLKQQDDGETVESVNASDDDSDGRSSEDVSGSGDDADSTSSEDDADATSSDDDGDATSSGDGSGDTSSATTTNAKFGVALGLMLAVPVLGLFL